MAWIHLSWLEINGLSGTNKSTCTSSDLFFSNYSISLYSFQGNYSFFNLDIVGNLISSRNISISYLVHWIFGCKNYSREETIQGWKLYDEILNFWESKILFFWCPLFLSDPFSNARAWVSIVLYQKKCSRKRKKSWCMRIMAIRVVEFSNGGYKIRKIFA